MDLVEKLKKHLEDPKNMEEALIFFNGNSELLNSRFLKFEKYLNNYDFDKLMLRLVNEHNDDYREKCYINGYEPYPNNKLQFIIDYIENKSEPIDIKIKELSCDFFNYIYLFNNYYFQIIHGQGSIIRIFNKYDKKLILTI